VEAWGCELLFLPPYSPIEKAFSKVKALLRGAKARTREALVEAIGRALSTVDERDAKGWCARCGYETEAQRLWGFCTARLRRGDRFAKPSPGLWRLMSHRPSFVRR
jgi:hypothetical protein